MPDTVTCTFTVDGVNTVLEFSKPAIAVFEDLRISQRRPAAEGEPTVAIDTDLGAMLKRMILETATQLLVRPMLGT
jgi:hypothetical protein